MFTGIITDIGTVRASEQRGDLRLTITTGYDTASIDLGASIACSGVCLTVVDKGDDWFAVDVSGETRSRTAKDLWREGAKLNLERSLRLGDELGGHIVSGHVDGVARIADIRPDGESRRFTVEVPLALARYIASKGSVALDGISLTVNDVDQTRFGINLIPHTLTHTTWGAKKPGDKANLEIDVLARYVLRAMELKS